VLVVEDDAAMRDCLREILEEEGHPVLLAENGRDGLQQLRRSPVSVVLLDVMMPVMNGLEFLAAKLCDEAICDVPVVLMTAHSLDAPQLVGITAAFTKPFKMESLLKQVKALCARPGVTRVARLP
jgi:CheY-like chemotaxis protein